MTYPLVLSITCYTFTFDMSPHVELEHSYYFLTVTKTLNMHNTKHNNENFYGNQLLTKFVGRNSFPVFSFI